MCERLSGDNIASIVIDRYDSLPSKGKPLIRSNGVSEWTIVSGVVIFNTASNQLECVSLATGVKALPDSKIRGCQGLILHDCHAEILAIRAFNLYVIEHGFEHIGAIHLYVNAPPCGDASMSLLNGAESWTKDPVLQPNSLIRGRAHFNCLGHIRTKPGRSDSSVTMSKSCSDKLTLRQSRGLFLCPLRYALRTTRYLDFLVCPQPDQVTSDFERAFSRWNPLRRFQWLETRLVVGPPPPSDRDSKPGWNQSSNKNKALPVQESQRKSEPSPCSLVWFPGTLEVIANGIKQGSKCQPSALSRSNITKAARAKWPEKFANVKNYRQLKEQSSWPPCWERTADDDFAL